VHDAAQGTSPVTLSDVTAQNEKRILTQIHELDRVLGGGVVPGSVTLIGGDPGIGKSTLVLQTLTRLASQGLPVLYVSGEESPGQIKMRAERVGSLAKKIFILPETSLDHILRHISDLAPKVVVIDSVQTIYTDDLESAPGSVSQLRESSFRLINQTKASDTASFLIGHVTKEGAIAGPRVLEHMVDTVLYFEGDRGHSYRILRAVKNRFGSTDEIGVFEMSSRGLREVASPSEMFIAERPRHAPGSALVASIEGTRPILVEIQALVAPTCLNLPRRTTIGFDQNRASLLVAVIEKRLGIPLYNQDIFVNVAGGIRLSDPGVDLGVVTAIVSSTTEQPVPADTVICGEVGLTGEIRAVPQIAQRLREAQRLGFARCIIPHANKQIQDLPDIKIAGVDSVGDTAQKLFHGRAQNSLRNPAGN
jgi:DNA repair protein RadA/Sms